MRSGPHRAGLAGVGKSYKIKNKQTISGASTMRYDGSVGAKDPLAVSKNENDG